MLLKIRNLKVETVSNFIQKGETGTYINKNEIASIISSL